MSVKQICAASSIHGGIWREIKAWKCPQIRRELLALGLAEWPPFYLLFMWGLFSARRGVGDETVRRHAPFKTLSGTDGESFLKFAPLLV